LDGLLGGSHGVLRNEPELAALDRQKSEQPGWPVPDSDGLIARYRVIRRMTEELARPLGAEDCQIQSMPDASPTKWHLAHTSWFFETFVLGAFDTPYEAFDDSFNYLYNSYYNAVGARLARPSRGLITRPSLDRVYAYRASVDRALEAFVESMGSALKPDTAAVIELGLNHEQQHQELILTDIKHALAQNPLRPNYREGVAVAIPSSAKAPGMEWLFNRGGVTWIGHDGRGFAFDNESPQHRAYLEDCELGSRLVSSGEYRAFIDDGGYARPELWLSDGWNVVNDRQWTAPLYWEKHQGEWWAMTLGGFRPIADSEPVCHVSFYEAEAYARWAGARLPTEAEWEHAASEQEPVGNFVERGHFHPRPAETGTGFAQFFGDVWEWTQSAYLPYPGSRPAAGALGEYNAKFMCNQMVLRGGSCATPATHIRPTYRNFFPPDARWQFTGIRLARDV
jgi:ergothioneine biosynthesis protein EgtB